MNKRNIWMRLRGLLAEQRDELSEEISGTELKKAMDSFPKGKTPGMDRLPIVFYSKFWPEISNIGFFKW